MKRKISLFLSILLVFIMMFTGCGNKNESSVSQTNKILKDSVYTTKEDVAQYINLYNCLPSNYITKSQAQKLGWDSSKGNLKTVAPGKSIGGDRYGNYEKKLPVKSGRTYYECDIDSDGGFRNAKRIIYSNDGLIYYTENHYETFELLYGNE